MYVPPRSNIQFFIGCTSHKEGIKFILNKNFDMKDVDKFIEDIITNDLLDDYIYKQLKTIPGPKSYKMNIDSYINKFITSQSDIKKIILLGKEKDLKILESEKSHNISSIDIKDDLTIPFSSEYFSIAISPYSFHNCKYLEEVLIETFRILEYSGLFIVCIYKTEDDKEKIISDIDSKITGSQGENNNYSKLQEWIKIIEECGFKFIRETDLEISYTLVFKKGNN